MENQYFLKILEKVKEERNVDFSQYRSNLLERRVMVRVRAVKRDNFEQYFAFLKFHPAEIDNLMEALTINVTEFFRDPKVFEVIEKRVIPGIINKKRMSHDSQRMTIRVWSCGCATGEEPYSILMLFMEHLGGSLANFELTIFATDIDEKSLIHAQQGVYDVSAISKLSPDRQRLIEKYFYRVGEKNFWIREEMTSYVTFQYHDVIADIPFDRLDLILCRNVFIYFARELQDQVISRFASSLNKGGFYVMGNVESMLGSGRENFYEYDRDARMYVKK